MADAVSEWQHQGGNHRVKRADVPEMHRLVELLLDRGILAQETQDKHRDEHVDQDVGERVLLGGFFIEHECAAEKSSFQIPRERKKSLPEIAGEPGIFSSFEPALGDLSPRAGAASVGAFIGWARLTIASTMGTHSPDTFTRPKRFAPPAEASSTVTRSHSESMDSVVSVPVTTDQVPLRLDENCGV